MTAEHWRFLPPPSSRLARSDQSGSFLNPLLLVALAIDVLAPFLIWKGFMPASLRWVSHASLVLVMVGAVVRMLVFNRFPSAIWVISWVSIMGIGVATLHGQGPVPTLWGWWLMFQYPLVGLFVYLQPGRYANFSRRFYLILLSILGLQVIVQIGQYLMGEVPGDNLAGTFGRNGTGNLGLFILIVLCVAFGRWLAQRRWMPVLVVMALGGISSILGELKLFWVAAVVIAGLAMVVYLLQGRSFHRLVPLGAILAATLITFGTWYNAVVPYAQGTPLQDYLENPRKLVEYLNFVQKTEDQGRYYYDIGRNYALRYAWTSLSDDPLSLFFGLGLGARGESETLGTTGTAISGGYLSWSTGTSLLVMMQEIGIVGIGILMGFIIVTTVTLVRDVRSNPESNAVELRYALIFFTLLWPLWIWYNTAWTLRVPMLLYWIMLGYVLADARSLRLQANQLPTAQTQVSDQP